MEYEAVLNCYTVYLRHHEPDRMGSTATQTCAVRQLCCLSSPCMRRNPLSLLHPFLLSWPASYRIGRPWLWRRGTSMMRPRRSHWTRSRPTPRSPARSATCRPRASTAGIHAPWLMCRGTSYHLSTPICQIFTPFVRPAHDASGWWCTCSLRLIQQPDKPGTMPSFQHVYERILPWCLIFSSTSSR